MLFSVAATAAPEMPDPTRPLNQRLAMEGIREAGLKLDSVLISAQRKLAVINGVTLAEQDTINGARVLGILPGEVELSRAGRRIHLQLHSRIRTAGEAAQ